MSDTSPSDSRTCALYYWAPLCLTQHGERHSDCGVYWERAREENYKDQSSPQVCHELGKIDHL